MGQSDSRSSTSNWLLRQSKPFLLICSLLTISWLLLEWTKGKAEGHLYLNSFTSESGDPVFKVITRIGEGWIFLLAFILFLFKSFRDAIGAVLCALAVLFLAAALKNWVFPDFRRPLGFFGEGILRLPENLSIHKNNSFPSGHTMGSFASLAYLATGVNSKSLVWGLAVLALLAGLSRVYLTQHFLEDVVAGAWLGSLLAWGIWRWTREWKSPFFDKKLG